MEIPEKALQNQVGNNKLNPYIVLVNQEAALGGNIVGSNNLLLHHLTDVVT